MNPGGGSSNIPYLPSPFGITENMDDPGNEQRQFEGIESAEASMAGELSFDGGGKSGVSSAGDFSASQDKGGKRKRRASFSGGSNVSCKRINCAMTKQEKDETREKNKNSVKAAQVREVNRFMAWFPNQERTEPVEWSGIDAMPDKIEGGGRKEIRRVWQTNDSSSQATWHDKRHRDEAESCIRKLLR